MNDYKTFLLIASPSENHEGKRISALEMAKRRLNAGQWGFWAHTPHRAEIDQGDLCIVYLAGADGKQFVATARVTSVKPSLTKFNSDGDALTDQPVSILHLEDIDWFDKAVFIAEIKDALDFIPKGVSRWGCVLQRGVKKISSKDARTIVYAAKQTLNSMHLKSYPEIRNPNRK